MNKKGQALVEFVAVMPILILILIAIVDFSNIIFTKIKLENILDDMVILYEKNELEKVNSLAHINNYNINYNTNDKMVTITLSKTIKINTPFLNLVFGNNYVIEEKRIIYE